MKSMIVAYDAHRAIGKDGGRPWAGGKMRSDMKHFRELTKDKTVIMGRRTFSDDIGGTALPKRQNIILTRGDFSAPDVVVTHSLQEAYALAEYDIVIIGGSQVYSEALPDVDVIYATEIHGDIHGDAFFPPLSNEWKETSRENFPADSENIYPYSFITYQKQS